MTLKEVSQLPDKFSRYTLYIILIPLKILRVLFYIVLGLVGGLLKK